VKYLSVYYSVQPALLGKLPRCVDCSSANCVALPVYMMISGIYTVFWGFTVHTADLLLLVRSMVVCRHGHHLLQVEEATEACLLSWSQCRESMFFHLGLGAPSCIVYTSCRKLEKSFYD
jgi:hypothetical protein